MLLFLIFNLCTCEFLDLKLINSDTAKCLDGSSPGYYIQHHNNNKWLIFHEGGGWCTSMEDCLARSKTDLGSTKNRPKQLNIKNLNHVFSNDPSNMMHQWNKVFLIYCDGGSFTGNTIDGLHFKGRQNLIALKEALDIEGLSSNTTDVVISGCSAGGLATYLNLDWWRDNIPLKVKVTGLPIDGFFLDLPPHQENMKWVFQHMNSSTNEQCQQQLGYKCMFAEHIIPYIKTPLYVLNSRYDSYDVTQSGYNKYDYGELFLHIFNNTNGFINGCLQHCSNNIYIINGIDSYQAFSLFYNNTNNTLIEYHPCWKCCGYPTIFIIFIIILILIFIFISIIIVLKYNNIIKWI